MKSLKSLVGMSVLLWALGRGSPALAGEACIVDGLDSTASAEYGELRFSIIDPVVGAFADSTFKTHPKKPGHQRGRQLS